MTVVLTGAACTEARASVCDLAILLPRVAYVVIESEWCRLAPGGRVYFISYWLLSDSRSFR